MAGKKNVNSPSLDWGAMEAHRKLPRALVGGTEEMRKGGEEWTPRLEGETDVKDAKYKARLAHHFLVDFYDSAVSDLVDRMFSQGIQIEDMPPRVEELWENIDGQGRSGEKFFHKVALDAARYGLSEVQVDHTPRKLDSEGEPVELTDAQEARLGRRPFLVHRMAKDVIEVKAMEDDGLPKIERSRIRESVTETDGYDEETVDQVRELMRGRASEDGLLYSSYQLYRRDKVQHEETERWEKYGPVVENNPPNNAPAEVREKFVEVFLVPFYMGFDRFHVAYPQWEGAAWLCLQHWQKKGDVDWIEHLACTPSLVHTGERELEIKSLGSRKVAEIGTGETIEWLVLDPKGINATKESIEHLEEHIRLVTRQPMVRRATGKDLVGVRQLDETRPMTRAQMWAMGVAQSITQCLDMMAWWRGLPRGGVATFPKDALQRLVDPEGFADVIEMAKAKIISTKTAQQEAIRYNRLDEEHDVDADLELLADERSASMAMLPDFGEESDKGDDES